MNFHFVSNKPRKIVSRIRMESCTCRRGGPPPPAWHENVTDGWGSRPLRWLSVLVLGRAASASRAAHLSHAAVVVVVMVVLMESTTPLYLTPMQFISYHPFVNQKSQLTSALVSFSIFITPWHLIYNLDVMKQKIAPIVSLLTPESFCHHYTLPCNNQRCCANGLAPQKRQNISFGKYQDNTPEGKRLKKRKRLECLSSGEGEGQEGDESQ